MLAPLKLTPLAARRLARRLVRLDEPLPDVGSALAYHGYIQIDPINVCGRMHDLILRNRVAGYREGDLMRHLHGSGSPWPAGQRQAFEHHLPASSILVALPLDAWPHLLATMRARTKRAGPWSGRLSPRERELAERLLVEIAARGPLNSDAITDERRARRVWGQATLVKATLQKLFFHGRVLIARREGTRRFYDLPDRVLPASTLGQPEPSAQETARWQVLAKLRQRRLATLKRDEWPRIEDRIQPIQVDGCPLLYCLREDVALIDSIAGAPAPEPGENSLRLLAPLDPLIYDRVVTARLWNFDYTWEVYTPPAKRVRGYYALPVLAGTELVGHVDAKADRPAKKLRVVGRSLRRGFRAAPAVQELARWLGLR